MNSTVAATTKNCTMNKHEIYLQSEDGPRVVLISGHAQSGKDTTANIMARQLREAGESVLITHYADLLKYVCKTFFEWNGKKDEYGRSLLQFVGTNIVRKQQPDFWADFLASMISFFKPMWDWVIIPDARFPNEIECMYDKGLRVTHVRIERENHNNGLTMEQAKHESETALDDYMPDYLINNEGDISELEESVRTVIDYMKRSSLTTEFKFYVRS